MFVRRSNSSSSIASNSSATTISANGNQSNGVPNGEGSQVRKKPARGPWPSSKAEPVAGLSTARSHYVAATPSGPSAASAISALHTSSQGGLQQHAMNAQSQPQTNGYGRTQQSDVSAALWLLPMNGTFERKTIDVPFHPDILKIGRQTNAKTLPTPLNGYFDSKVLSRQHAEIWAERDGKIWIRDIRSSNGTFVNSKRLSLENRDSEPHPLKDQDILELGIDIVSEDGRSIVHHKVAARVEHAGIHNSGNNGMDFGNANSSNEPNPGQRWTHDWRNRNNSQGSIAGARSANTYPNGSSAAAYHSKWLQPVTMEQIVKKLKVRPNGTILNQLRETLTNVGRIARCTAPSSKSASYYRFRRRCTFEQTRLFATSNTRKGSITKQRLSHEVPLLRRTTSTATIATIAREAQHCTKSTQSNRFASITAIPTKIGYRKAVASIAHQWCESHASRPWHAGEHPP